MYAPAAFRWDDRAAALAFARARSFAALITVVDGAPMVSHLPFLVDDDGARLRGHLARANPHAAHLDGLDHLAVFAGPDAYVSPDWYETGEDVPTWNYVVVHVRGRGRVYGDDADIDRQLCDLSDLHESQRHDLATGTFWKIHKLDARAVERMRRAIVAFEIDIEAVEGKAKLSQNKKPEVAARVIAKLEGSPHERARTVAALAAERLRSRR